MKNLYTIPKNTFFWSISLQESVSCDRDLIIDVKQQTTCNDDIFGFIQIKFENILLQQYMGTDAISFRDKVNGEISIDKNLLIKYKI